MESSEILSETEFILSYFPSQVYILKLLDKAWTKGLADLRKKVPDGKKLKKGGINKMNHPIIKMDKEKTKYVIMYMPE